MTAEQLREPFATRSINQAWNLPFGKVTLNTARDKLTVRTVDIYGDTVHREYNGVRTLANTAMWKSWFRNHLAHNKGYGFCCNCHTMEVHDLIGVGRMLDTERALAAVCASCRKGIVGLFQADHKNPIVFTGVRF